MSVNPDLAVYLADHGVFSDGKPDRQFFEEECERSRRAIELGKVEMDRELQRILVGEV